jgi:Ser-tRNA(Ala) deacylase AlaX
METNQTNNTETKLIYLEHMQQLSCEAKVVSVSEQDGKHTLTLDQTVFYPQGGGQPYDTGTITNGGLVFRVDEVRFIDGQVHHIGTFASEAFTPGEAVTCQVDEPRRRLNTRLHSAGHLIDMGLKKLDITWKPGKGYHFPAGAYVEYEGSLLGVDTEKLKTDLAGACNRIISSGIVTTTQFLENEKVNGKPKRLVNYGDFAIACGGTHVTALADIGELIIRKIKPEKGAIRIGYDVTR